MFYETFYIVTKTELTQWIRLLREKTTFLDLFKKFSAFAEIEWTLPCTKGPAICHNPGPHKCTPNPNHITVIYTSIIFSHLGLRLGSRLYFLFAPPTFCKHFSYPLSNEMNIK